MSVGRNKAMTRFLEMLERGEIERARHGAKSNAEWAARLGMTVGQFRGLQRRATTALGLTVPTWTDTTPTITSHSGQDNDRCGDFEDEEPTVRVEPETGHPALGVPESGQDDFHIRAKSTLKRPDGSVVLEWVKTTANTNVDPVAVLRAAFGEEMPRFPIVTGPAYSDEDLMCAFWLGDPHCGALAWAEECGENYDLEIFERNLVAAADRLVAVAPPAKYAVIASVGDYFHSDGNNATTKGTRVDVDGRTPKMIATGIRTMRRIIERALEKHEHVHVICARGNHDELLSLVLALALAQFYESNPRVTVDTSPEMYHWYRFGQNLIGVTHGDKAKPMDMMGVMACDRAKDWGETAHRFIMCGHVHHSQTKEVPGVVVEYLRTLAGTDAWHRGQGYRSGRDMRMDVFHREWGRITRNIVGIEEARMASNG